MIESKDLGIPSAPGLWYAASEPRFDESKLIAALERYGIKVLLKANNDLFPFKEDVGVRFTELSSKYIVMRAELKGNLRSGKECDQLKLEIESSQKILIPYAILAGEAIWLLGVVFNKTFECDFDISTEEQFLSCKDCLTSKVADGSLDLSSYDDMQLSLNDFPKDVVEKLFPISAAGSSVGFFASPGVGAPAGGAAAVCESDSKPSARAGGGGA